MIILSKTRKYENLYIASGHDYFVRIIKYLNLYIVSGYELFIYKFVYNFRL